MGFFTNLHSKAKSLINGAKSGMSTLFRGIHKVSEPISNISKAIATHSPESDIGRLASSVNSASNFATSASKLANTWIPEQKRPTIPLTNKKAILAPVKPHIEHRDVRREPPIVREPPREVQEKPRVHPVKAITEQAHEVAPHNRFGMYGAGLPSALKLGYDPSPYYPKFRAQY
jgi:hypothetical protein